MSAGQFVASLTYHINFFSRSFFFSLLMFDHPRCFSLFRLFILLYYLFYMSAILCRLRPSSFCLFKLCAVGRCREVFFLVVCLFIFVSKMFVVCSSATMTVVKKRRKSLERSNLMSFYFSIHILSVFFPFFRSSVHRFDEDR